MKMIFFYFHANETYRKKGLALQWPRFESECFWNLVMAYFIAMGNLELLSHLVQKRYTG